MSDKNGRSVLERKPRLARFAQATSVLFSLPLLTLINHHNSIQFGMVGVKAKTVRN
ncbi:unnamed protein product [Sphenostylis stenocarpa]|uniref:Uncharacterized protein n=1 Tax=Sphenostylis stenocarpa TaxID=92480 RepID=A0AA86S7H3_9FABA|nr:unnamed protein product [Sphenostylis stenocarpa]